MSDEINPRIMAALAELVELFPKAEHDETTCIAYARRLNDLPEPLVLAAIEACARTATFFPSLAEIRKRATAIAGDSVLVDPEAAWGEVLREVKRVGVDGRRSYYHKGQRYVIERQFSSPMIAAAADAVGWRDICLTETDDLPTLRAQFRDALRAIQAREVDRIVSGRHTSGPALDAGEQREGFVALADVVPFRREDRS